MEKKGFGFTRIFTVPGAEDRGNCLSVKIGHMGYGEAPDVGND